MEKNIEQLRKNTRFVYMNYSVCAAVRDEYQAFIDYDFWDIEFVDLSNVIDILKSKKYSEYYLRENLFSYSIPRFFNDLFYLNSYQDIKKYIEDEITAEQLIFDNHIAKNDPIFIFKFNKILKQKLSYLNSINKVIQLAIELKKLMFAIDGIEAMFQAKKTELIQCNTKLLTMPTWANESEIETIWSELISLKFVDAKDKNNFLLAFGFGDKKIPYEQFSLGKSATNLMVLLILMIDRTSKTLSVENRKLANDLFTIQLNMTTKPNKNDIETWCDKLQNTDILRKSDKQYFD